MFPPNPSDRVGLFALETERLVEFVGLSHRERNPNRFRKLPRACWCGLSPTGNNIKLGRFPSKPPLSFLLLLLLYSKQEACARACPARVLGSIPGSPFSRSGTHTFFIAALFLSFRNNNSSRGYVLLAYVKRGTSYVVTPTDFSASFARTHSNFFLSAQALLLV